MKLVKISAVIFALLLQGCLNSTTNSSEANFASPPDVQTYSGVAVFDSYDTASGNVTIHHDPIQGYMTEMDMTSKLKDPSLANGLKKYDIVSFDLERRGADLTVTKLGTSDNTALTTGRTIYFANCAVCHADNGDGAEKGIPLNSGHALHHGEPEFLKRVVNGKSDRMPAFRDKLKPAQVRAVVDYVRTGLVKKPDKTKGHQH